MFKNGMLESRMADKQQWKGEIPTVDYEDKVDNQLKECQNYTVNELFYSSFAPYFWQAVQLRYPEYTK